MSKTKSKSHAVADPFVDQQLCFGYHECQVNQLDDPDKVKFRLRYSEQPALREAVCDFLYELIDNHSAALTGDLCGRCGNSCRRGDIVVREQEILRLQQHLGWDENRFRAEHLLPSPTWNPNDGVMRLTPEGNCPFLKSEGEAGQPLSATCSVYEIRPQSCRDFASDKPFCNKNTGLLIEQLWLVFVDAHNTRVVTRPGGSFTLPTSPTWWRLLNEKMMQLEPSSAVKYERISKEIGETLERLISRFQIANLTPGYLDNVASLRRLVQMLAELDSLSPEGNSKVEALWVQLRKLEALIAAPPESSAAEPGPPDEEANEPEPPAVSSQHKVEWFMLQELSLAIRFAGSSEMKPVFFQGWQPLKEAVSRLLQRALERPEEILQDALREGDPPCYICGECCRFYSVEIKPSDIVRLCQILPETPASFVEKYTIPARHSWNKKARILRKVEAAVYTKGLRELKVVQESTTQQCVFLERRDDGFFYCGVHSHKPQVCRDYPATNNLCRDINQRANWGRQAHSVAWIEATASQIRIQTHDRVKANRPPLQFARSDWEEVDEAARVVEQLAAQAVLG